jgi:excisionase family DNA binding protein
MDLDRDPVSEPPTAANEDREPLVGVLLQEVRELRAQIAQVQSSALTVEQAGEMLGCGRRKVFELLKAKKLQRAPSLGRKTLVTRASVEQIQASRTPQQRQRQQKMDLARELADLEQQRRARRDRLGAVA